MGLFTFDWSQILYVGSPLTVPWWAQANAIVGFVMFYWIICPILYYKNVSAILWSPIVAESSDVQVWYSAYMPISTGAVMDRFGLPYNITSILSGTSIGHIDETAYHAYSPVYISITFAMTWTLAFALSTAAITHTILYHGGQIWRAMRHRQAEEPDVHAKLMRSYPKVPFWYVRPWLRDAEVDLSVQVVCWFRGVGFRPEYRRDRSAYLGVKAISIY